MGVLGHVSATNIIVILFICGHAGDFILTLLINYCLLWFHLNIRQTSFVFLILICCLEIMPAKKVAAPPVAIPAVTPALVPGKVAGSKSKATPIVITPGAIVTPPLLAPGAQPVVGGLDDLTASDAEAIASGVAETIAGDFTTDLASSVRGVRQLAASANRPATSGAAVHIADFVFGLAPHKILLRTMRYPKHNIPLAS